MHFNKAMIDILYEVRRTQSKTIKSALMLSSPNLGELMLNLYKSTNNIETKYLIAKFMREAGDDWLSRLVALETKDARYKNQPIGEVVKIHPVLRELAKKQIFTGVAV